MDANALGLPYREVQGGHGDPSSGARASQSLMVIVTIPRAAHRKTGLSTRFSDLRLGRKTNVRRKTFFSLIE
jgi:hypothetical protein